MYAITYNISFALKGIITSDTKVFRLHLSSKPNSKI